MSSPTLGTYSSGHYSASWNGADIGSTRSGIKLRPTYLTQEINDDALGSAIANAVMQGENLILELDYVNYSNIYAAIHVLEGNEGDGASNVGLLVAKNPGGPGLAKQLVLTAVSGTPNANDSGHGVTYTFYQAAIIEDVDILLASKLKEGTCHFRIYPSTDNNNKLYAVT